MTNAKNALTKVTWPICVGSTGLGGGLIQENGALRMLVDSGVCLRELVGESESGSTSPAKYSTVKVP